MLILRCLCPMISVPEYYNTCSDGKGAPSAGSRKSLVLQGKLLSNIANFSTGDDFELDEQLNLYKDHIVSNSREFKKWVNRVISDDFSSFNC